MEILSDLALASFLLLLISLIVKVLEDLFCKVHWLYRQVTRAVQWINIRFIKL